MRRLVLLLMLTAVLAACQPQAPAGVTTLIYASPYAPTHPFSRADEVWIRWVEAHSHGQLRIRALWSATLLSSEESMTELRHGVADIGLITPIYERGGEQLIRTQTGFYAGAVTIGQQIAMYDCLAATFPTFDEELRGLRVLAVQGGELPGVLTRDRSVHTLGELRGLRIRAPTELLGVLRDLGADPVDQPMDQVYSELAKGVLDGVIAPPDTLRSLHFAEVAHYYWQLAIPRGGYPGRAMNLSRWRQLTSAQRSLLTASMSIWEAAMTHDINASAEAGLQYGAQQGVRFTTASPEQQRIFDELYNRDEARAADALERYGIDGPAVYRFARQLAAGIQTRGEVRCPASDVAAVPALSGH